MVPLTADRAGDQWPATLTLTMRSGEAIEGIVAWIVPAELPRERGWTDDPRGLAVRAGEPSDHNGRGAVGMPVLLVHVPRHAAGELKLDRQTLRPRWLDVPEGAFTGAPPLARTGAVSEPDADSPFEYWRWTLVAEERGARPPAIDDWSPPAAMVAQHVAALWRIGLARLASIDPVLARDVRIMLTRTATDRGEPFAAWVADPEATGQLLTELLSDRQSDASLAEYVRIWMSDFDRAMAWPEADYERTLRLAVLSGTGQHAAGDMSLRFPGAAQSPMSFALEPNVLMRVLATKPQQSEDAVPAVYGRQPVKGETVIINMPGREMELPLRPRRYAVTPPGLFLAELGPPLTLAEVQTMQRLPLRQDQATLVSVRKLRGRWELFIDCRRPARASEEPARLPERFGSIEDLRGAEAITIFFGPERLEDGPSAILTVPEVGWARVYYGVQDGSLQVHTRSHADRWYARVVIPSAWLPHPDLGAALLGFARTHGESNAIETGPNVSVPWRIEPGRVALDISEWDGPAGE